MIGQEFQQLHFPQLPFRRKVQLVDEDTIASIIGIER